MTNPDAAPHFMLCAVPTFVEVAGRQRAVAAYAVVQPIATDPDDPERALVFVVVGAGELQDGQLATVPADRLLTREQAEARIPGRAPS